MLFLYILAQLYTHLYKYHYISCPANLSTLSDHPLFTSPLEILFPHPCKTSHPGTSCIFPDNGCRAPRVILMSTTPKNIPQNEFRLFLGILSLIFGKWQSSQSPCLQGFQANPHSPKNAFRKYHHVVGHGNFF